jgi:murein DD-endopeptidase MepM/ murein hydrolase activator NlpD
MRDRHFQFRMGGERRYGLSRREGRRRFGSLARLVLPGLLLLGVVAYFLPLDINSNVDSKEPSPALSAVAQNPLETVVEPAPEPQAEPVVESVAESPPTAEKRYGIVLEGLEVCEGKVQKGATLAGILGARGVCAQRIAALAEASKEVFDLRQLRPGRPYSLFVDGDGQPRHFIYESSPTEYVVFNLGDPVGVHAASKPVETKLRTAAATVSSSLWEALQNQGVDSNLIVSLDEVLGQSVDLFHLQPEDRIALVFEEIFVEGRKIGAGRIRAARMVHEGAVYNAFYYDDGRGGRYYDEKGRSVQHRFLRAPLRYNRISSGFSRSRLHPILNTYRPHLAIDYAAPTGTPVMAVGDGTVTQIGRDKHAGRYIRLRHGSRYESRYIHLSRFARGIHRGSRVQRGEVIGYVGQTGLATGPHLDFAFYRDGTPINYRTLNFPRQDPIPEDQRIWFDRGVLHLSRFLDETESNLMMAKQSASADSADDS